MSTSLRTESTASLPAYDSSRQTGMTLTELIVAMFLGGAVFLGLGWVYGFASGLWIQSEVKMRMQAEGTYALEQMVTAASQANNLTIRNGKKLELDLPASPLDKQPRFRKRSFELREQTLWMDGKLIIPSPGDSGFGVADLKLVDSSDATPGSRVLSLGVQLFSRETPTRPADSLWFETSVHLRNSIPTGSVTSGNLGGTLF